MHERRLSGTGPGANSGLRRALLAILVLGIVGTACELVLLGHYEKAWQLVPFGVLGAGLLAVAAAWARPGSRSATGIRLSSTLFVAAGITGLYRHYKGNVEFELEMYPTMRGAELFWKALTGATPALAPGTMIVLGLIGLAYAYPDPRPTRRVPSDEENEA